MGFRFDINGLRCLAVVMVVLFHFKVPYFNGGFAGVDIFFVISGFLMAKIYTKRIDSGISGVFSFYKDRFDRIYPALISVTFICFVFIYITQMSFVTIDFFNEAKYALSFTSNIFYQLNSGYFDVSSENRWLLHTWSLSVEWQFYLIFPVITLLFCYFFKKKYLPILYLVIFFISIFVCLYLYKNNQNYAFYSVQSRAWEMMLGAIISLIPEPRSVLKKPFEYIGVGLISYSMIYIANSDSWPNASTLAPVIGAALVIYSNIDNEKSILRNKAFQFIGNISYSLYLWHWPIAAYLNNKNEHTTSIYLMMYIFISVLLAYLSYRYIERWSKKNTIKLACYSILLLLLMCLASYSEKSKIDTLYSYKGYGVSRKADSQFGRLPNTCFLTSNNSSFSEFNKEKCLPYNANGNNVLLIGDSHAADLSTALRNKYNSYNFLQATASGCYPWVGIKGVERCTDMMSYMYNEYIKDKKFDIIIVSAYWFMAGEKNSVAGLDYIKNNLLNHANRLIIIGQSDVYSSPFYEVAMSKNKNEYISMQDKKASLFNKKIKEHSKKIGLEYVDIYNAIGIDDMLSKSGDPYMFDKNHFTKYGADKLIESIKLD